MQLMITVISCLNCGEKLGETKETIGSRRKGLYSLDTGCMEFKTTKDVNRLIQMDNPGGGR